jgi:hypothetical protein
LPFAVLVTARSGGVWPAWLAVFPGDCSADALLVLQATYWNY